MMFLFCLAKHKMWYFLCSDVDTEALIFKSDCFTDKHWKQIISLTHYTPTQIREQDLACLFWFALRTLV